MSHSRRLASKGEPERGEQRPASLVVGGRGADRDVHSPHLHHLVVVDFGEDQLLGDPERVVAAPVEGLRVQTTEVSDPGDQSLEKDEYIQLFKLPFQEALAMVERGEITDAKTQLALLLYARGTKPG